MTTVVKWSGREAWALREARRMSVRAFAAHLGLAKGSVVNWERRGELAHLRRETQEILDRDLSMVDEGTRERFEAALAGPPPTPVPAVAGGTQSGAKPHGGDAGRLLVTSAHDSLRLCAPGEDRLDVALLLGDPDVQERFHTRLTTELRRKQPTTGSLDISEEARGGRAISEQALAVAGRAVSEESTLPNSGDPVSRSSVPGLRALNALTTWVALQGSTGLYPVVREQIRRLDLDGQHQPQHPASTLADARWSEFMSWICDNDGSTDGGQWLSRAYRRAVEAGDPALTAYVLMRNSQRALDAGDIRTGLHLTRQALQDPHLPPKIDALCRARLAEALALVGDDDSLKLAADARQRAACAGEHPADTVAAHCDHRYLAATHARCRHLLGDHRSAARMLKEVLDDALSDSPLNTGMWLAYLADSCRPTDPEKAADTGTRALTVAQYCGSVRILRALLPLALALRHHRSLPPVERFLTAHRTALAGNLAG